MEIENEELISAIKDPQAVLKKAAEALEKLDLPVYNGIRVLESPMMAPDDQMLMVGTERMKKIKLAIAEYDERQKLKAADNETGKTL